MSCRLSLLARAAGALDRLHYECRRFAADGRSATIRCSAMRARRRPSPQPRPTRPRWPWSRCWPGSGRISPRYWTACARFPEQFSATLALDETVASAVERYRYMSGVRRPGARPEPGDGAGSRPQDDRDQLSRRQTLLRRGLSARADRHGFGRVSLFPLCAGRPRLSLDGRTGAETAGARGRDDHRRALAGDSGTGDTTACAFRWHPANCSARCSALSPVSSGPIIWRGRAAKIPDKPRGLRKLRSPDETATVGCGRQPSQQERPGAQELQVQVG